MNARTLIISYFFPPDGGPGTQRAAKFCKHLWRYGWIPTIITREIPDHRGRWDPEDESLLREIPGHTDVLRVPPRPQPTDWARDLPVIDSESMLGWAEAAFDHIAQAVRSRMIDVVFITMSPFDLAHLGRRIQTQLEIPVVYDLRDPWALDGWRMHRSRKKWQRDFDAMARTLAQADGIIANTPEAREAMLREIPGLHSSSICTIPNGYDEEDFPHLPGSGYRRDPEIFRLVHTGSLHGRRVENYQGLLGRLKQRIHFAPGAIDPSGRTLAHLLEAVKQLEMRKHPLVKKLKIILAGNADEADRRMVDQFDLPQMVQWTGYLPHHESVDLLEQADALFLPLHGQQDERRSLIVPGKTYEYLASGRPILGCLPAGDARDLVDSYEYGFVASPCDSKSIARSLMDLHEAWRGGQLDTPCITSWLPRYQRSQLAAKLAEYFDQVSGRVRRIAPHRRAA